jgi:hypothetical protein
MILYCYYVYGIYYISTEFFKYLNMEAVYLFMLSGHMSTQCLVKVNIAGPNGCPVWGAGFDRLDPETVRSNSV